MDTTRKNPDETRRHWKYFSTGNKLLINGNCIPINPELAKVIGEKGAIILQQIFFWCRTFEERGDTKHKHDGYYWAYNSVREWKTDNFPWMSEKTIERTLKMLEEKGLIVTANYNKMRSDRTLWYRVDTSAVINLFPDADDLILDPDIGQIINKKEYEEARANEPKR